MGVIYMLAGYLTIMPKVIPLLIILIMGYLFKKRKFLNKSTISEIKNFILNITLPALLFTAFLDIKFRKEYLVIIILVILINLFMLFIGKKVSPFLREEDPYLKLMFTGFEMGMIGIPLFTAIYGTENVKYIGIIDIGHEIYIWFILLGILFKLRQESKKVSSTQLFKSFISSPVIIAILLGIAANITGLGAVRESSYLALSFMGTIEMIASLTVPLILIIIGYEMEFKTNNILLPIKIISLRLVILIPLALLINRFVFAQWLNLESIYNIALMTMLIMPPPFIIPLFIKEKDLSSRKYIYNTLSLSTLLSIAIFILTVLIYIE